MIRALVVDDSAFMRKAISMMLERASDIEVVDTATNGVEAVEKAHQVQPDVITMDVEMPRMDGITAVRKIMKEAPCPILMVSSLTAEGAETTVEALRAGAADFIPKQNSHVSLQIKEIEDELIKKVRSLSKSRARLFRKGAQAAEKDRSSAGRSSSEQPRRSSCTVDRPERPPQLMAIGVSTGGPFALQRVIPALPAELPVPVAVVQHMPPHFTRSLADRLDSLSALHVTEATDGMKVEVGHVIVAAGGHHLTFERSGSDVVAHTPPRIEGQAHCPSVDVMFQSASDVYGGDVLALVMTGMGKDGLQGAQRVKEEGGTLFAQDEASCVVYGMPRAVAEAGLTDAILPLKRLPEALKRAAGTPALASSQE